MQGNPDFYRDGKAAGKWMARRPEPFASQIAKKKLRLLRSSQIQESY